MYRSLSSCFKDQLAVAEVILVFFSSRYTLFWRLEMLEDSLLFTNRIKPARFRNVLTSFAVIATENMSFSQLPEELVDSIADYLENGAIFLVELGTEPLLTQKSCQIDESRSLLSLCLVSHRTLPSARRALYRRPFVVYDVMGIEGLLGRSLSAFSLLSNRIATS